MVPIATSADRSAEKYFRRQSRFIIEAMTGVDGKNCPDRDNKCYYYVNNLVGREARTQVNMPADRDILAMLSRVRPLLGEHPDIMRDYLFYRSEIEFQKHRLDSAERKALTRFDQFLNKHRRWIEREVYDPETLSEAREQFDSGHWWWYLIPEETK